MLDGQIAASSFIEEFRAFTREVAGKLDFGIYSFALDTMYRSMRIPVAVKKLLTLEILKFPPLIRRELLSNLLAYPGQTRDLIKFAENLIAQHLACLVKTGHTVVSDFGIQIRYYSFE